MKRSEINQSIDLAKKVFEENRICLPPFAFWTVEEWNTKGSEFNEIRECMLGWDVTDFGLHDFSRFGRTLFTLRNGNARNPNYPKAYGEKLILNPELQRAPSHFHISKMEDIINRGGGSIIVQLYKADTKEGRSNERLSVQVDGQTLKLEAGGIVRLQPGESICLTPRIIHQFWGERGTGLTVSGEVSSVCDDRRDNFFIDPVSRFPKIVEDENPIHYLCNEYPNKCAS